MKPSVQGESDAIFIQEFYGQNCFTSYSAFQTLCPVYSFLFKNALIGNLQNTGPFQLHTSPLVALSSEDIVIFYIWLFDMRNPSGCSTQSLLIVHVVQLLGNMS